MNDISDERLRRMSACLDLASDDEGFKRDMREVIDEVIETCADAEAHRYLRHEVRARVRAFARTIEDALRLAKVAHEQAIDTRRVLTRRADEAEEYARHAEDLQEILDEAAPSPVSDADALAATSAVALADQVLVQVRDAQRLIAEAEIAARAAQVATAAEDAGRQLDSVVRTLSDEAPAALLAADEDWDEIDVHGQRWSVRGRVVTKEPAAVAKSKKPRKG